MSESSWNFIQAFGMPSARDPDQQEWVAPPWFGPPNDELPACVPLDVVVARSGSAVIALSHALVYSTGIAFEFTVRARNLSDRDAQRLFHEQHMPPTEDDPSPAFLRVGVELADGSRASNLGGRRGGHDPKHEPDGPVLMQHGGGGGSSGRGQVSMRPGFWLWPLPPPGVVRVVCEWPLLDIPVTACELDAVALRSASERAVKLWDA